ncbi:hypothetical protein VTK73DRAFT_4831 [Phialemonium thermophilum]|uniref:Uncharacterized protein n=1 Tax=Phialemonium thermophilum TaxID=223376 RepID=A0ABR3V5M6_9PEZI
MFLFWTSAQRGGHGRDPGTTSRADIPSLDGRNEASTHYDDIRRDSSVGSGWSWQQKSKREREGGEAQLPGPSVGQGRGDTRGLRLEGVATCTGERLAWLGPGWAAWPAGGAPRPDSALAQVQHRGSSTHESTVSLGGSRCLACCPSPSLSGSREAHLFGRALAGAPSLVSMDGLHNPRSVTHVICHSVHVYCM